MVLVIISFILYLAYNITSILLFGVPSSLSNTYYLYKKYNFSWIFSVGLFIMSALLMPGWINLMEGSNFQFLAFLAPIGMTFVAMAPESEGNGLDKTVHFTSAIIAGTLGLIASILVLKSWLAFIIITVAILSLSLITKSLKKCWLYWVETIIFLTTYIAIFQIK